MPPKKQYPCLVCEKDVGGKTGSVQCNFCDKWVHPVCGGISKPHMEILLENPSTTWTCKPCFGVSSKIKKEVQVLALKQEQCRKDIESNKEEIIKVKARMDQVEKKVEEISKDEIVKASTDLVFKELRERENRKHNLVIHKIPELVGNNVTNKDRKEHDVEKVTEIFNYLNCNVHRDDIRFIYRPGDKIVPEWPRPVILSLKDPGARQYILTNTYKLANSDLSSVSIVPDLTLQQRNEEEELRKEAVKLNGELSREEAENWEWSLVGLRGQKRLVKRRKLDRRGRGGAAHQPGGETRSRPQEPRPPTAQRQRALDMETRTSRGGRGSSRGPSRGRPRDRSPSIHRTTTVTRPQEEGLVGSQTTSPRAGAGEKEKGEKEKGGNMEQAHLTEEEMLGNGSRGPEAEDQDTDKEATSSEDETEEEEGGGRKRGRECSTSPTLHCQKKPTRKH